MSTDHEQSVITFGADKARRYGCHELQFSGDHVTTAKIPALPLNLTYKLPSGARIAARAYARGDGKAVSRCYLPESGKWTWEAKSSFGKGVASGEFLVEDSELPGKARVSHVDTRQFAYDSRHYCLHLGDTAETLLTSKTDNWQAYIDQAIQAGFTKIRARLAATNDSAANLFNSSRTALNIESLDRIEERLDYALQRSPHLQFQLDLLANDRGELERFEEGDPLSHLALAYLAERFSALPNLHWSIAADIDPAKDSAVTLQAVSRMGKALFELAPWHSMIVCGQPRFADFLFEQEKWCSYASLSNLGQVAGEAAQINRRLSQKPIALDSDRAEYEDAPLEPRYYFRRLFWGSLLSGSHPTYRGLDTSSSGSGHKSGIVPYYDACHSDRLGMGAHDFAHIRSFISQTCQSLEGWVPDDSISGGKPLLAKSMRAPDSASCIVYIANPDLHDGHTGKAGAGFYTDQRASASDIFTTFNLELPFQTGSARWFSPRSGEWKGQVEIAKASTIFLTPEPGDWLLWIEQERPKGQ